MADVLVLPATLAGLIPGPVTTEGNCHGRRHREPVQREPLDYHEPRNAFDVIDLLWLALADLIADGIEWWCGIV